MKKITAKQKKEIVALFEDMPAQEVDALLASGLLADLRDASFTMLDREEFRCYIGLTPVPIVLPVWKTRRIGGKSNKKLLQEIETSRCWISEETKAIIAHKDFPRSQQAEPVDFIRCGVEDLGFTDRPSFDEIEQRVLALGYSPCQPHDGASLGLDYPKQRKGESFLLVMDPITFSDGRRVVFSLENDAGMIELQSFRVDSATKFDLGRDLVFRK